MSITVPREKYDDVKIDVVIPALRMTDVRSMLLEELKASPWVGKIIIEPSSPLSYARINGAKKATTPIILCVDGDVDLPGDYFEYVYPSMLQEGVVAVDSFAYNWNLHDLAYRVMFVNVQNKIGRIIPMFKSKGWDNRAYLVKRELYLKDWNPPPCFYSEDELFYVHAIKYGKWIHLPFHGVKHFGQQKSYVNFAYAVEQYNCYRSEGKQKMFTLVKLVLARAFVSFLATAYSRSPKTFYLGIKFGVETIAGTLMAKLRSDKSGKTLS